jgi:hypothetical protein
MFISFKNGLMERKKYAHRKNGLQHVHKTEDSKLPEQILEYLLKGRRVLLRPLRRPLADIRNLKPKWNSLMA